MPCIKTGQDVYVSNYGLYARCDVHAVENVAIFRFSHDCRDYGFWSHDAPASCDVLEVSIPLFEDSYLSSDGLIIAVPFDVLDGEWVKKHGN